MEKEKNKNISSVGEGYISMCFFNIGKKKKLCCVYLGDWTQDLENARHALALSYFLVAFIVNKFTELGIKRKPF